MIKIIFRAVLILLFLLCFSELKAGNQYLLVVQKNGTTTGFALAEKPVIDCSLGKLSITSNNHCISIPLADIQRYSLVDEVPSSIPLLRYENGNINLKSGHVSIESMPSNSIVSVFGIDGKVLNTYTSDSNGHIEFDLPKNCKITILKTNSTSIKIINK